MTDQTREWIVKRIRDYDEQIAYYTDQETSLSERLDQIRAEIAKYKALRSGMSADLLKYAYIEV